MDEHESGRLPVGVIRVSGDGRVAGVNDWFAGWLGRDSGDLVGIALDDVLVDAEDDIATGADRSGPRMMLDVRRPERAALVTRTKEGDEHVLVVLGAEERYRALTDLRRRYSLADRTRARLELIMDSAVEFATATTEERLAEILASTTTRAYRAEDSTVYLHQPSGATSILAGEHPLRGVAVDTLIELVSAPRRVVKIEGPDEGDQFAPGLGEAMRTAGIHALIAAPLHHEETDFGAFATWFRHDRTFDGEAAPLAEAVAGQAAQALATLRLQAQLAHAATHDDVTGLPNRRLLESQMSELTGRVGHAVLFIDLDGFKQINDRLGHHAGDRVLREVARLLLGAVRSGDLVARYGGDEFVVACPVEEASVATDIAERILTALHESDFVSAHRGELGASIGVAMATSESTLQPDQLIRRADIAMYRAKSAGGNRVDVANF